MIARQPWSDFAQARSKSFVADLVNDAEEVSPDDLVDISTYRQQERIQACGVDPLNVLVAYAQDELIYQENRIVKIAREAYNFTPREGRVNVFGLSYRPDAKLWMHTILADIMVAASIHLYQTQRWMTTVYDGLRTVEGAFKLYNFASDEDLEAGLLALPGKSAHNKGMAVDSMMADENGLEVEMGGHFDHLNMVTNSRVYTGGGISPAARKNRLIREAAFLRAAFTHGLLIAPLRSEFWDDRLPENREDLWRVLDSAARVMGMNLLAESDVLLMRSNRKAFRDKWERWSYADFQTYWQELFAGMEGKLEALIGVKAPPAMEKKEFYHGNFHPIYDANLRASGKHQT